jgi:hypothetical protein
MINDLDPQSAIRIRYRKIIINNQYYKSKYVHAYKVYMYNVLISITYFWLDGWVVLRFASYFHRTPYDFLAHPIAPCGTLVVLQNTRRETWDNFVLIG